VTIHYLSSGRDVRTNHILNPDFEIDASNWRPLNSHSTIEVVDGHQFHGGKALKITGDGLDSGDRYGATYDGPVGSLAVADIRAPLTTGNVSLVASMSTDTAATTGYLGSFRYAEAAELTISGGSKYLGTVTSTPKRFSMDIGSYVSGGLDNTHYVRPQISFDNNGAGVYYIDAVMLTADYFEDYSGTGWPSFISGNRTNGEDGLDYAWTGTAHASTSTGTATRWVDIPDTGVIGGTFTVTGDDFIPNEFVRVWVLPEVATSTYWDTTANADGTFEYSFTMPEHTGGATRVRVAGAVFGNHPGAEQVVTIPTPPPLSPPPTTSTQKINYFLDPRLERTDGMTTLAKNYFFNGSPIDSLSGFTAAGTATIALDPTSAIKGVGGIKVTSPDAVSGIEIRPQDPGTFADDEPAFTVYVRAREAMTVTASVSADYTQWTLTDNFGWGDFGWGEPYTYVEGWSHTFAADEVKRFRVMPKIKSTTSGGTYPGGNPGPDIGWVLQLFGDGEFDIDGVWFGAGVDDGVDPEGFPGGVYNIPDAPLFFSGDTPDDDTYTYEWEGTPRASISLKKAARTKFLRSYNAGIDTEQNYILELPGGEKVAAMQSAWDEEGSDTSYFTADGRADGVGEDLRFLGLTEGTSYALSFDLTSAIENYNEGYVVGLWDQAWVTSHDDAYIGIPMSHPTERRITIPFTVGAGSAEVSMSCYRNWYTGYHIIDNVSLVEIDFHMPQYWDAEYGVPGTLDILAAGAVAGGTYTALADAPLADGDYYRAEYQAEAEGAWTTLTEVLYDADNKSEMREWTFTIPEGAVGARLAWSVADGSPYLNLYSTPVPYFDGDTEDADGFWYWWTGTPGESASIRSTEPPSGGPGVPIGAQVFVDGVGITAAEFRIAFGMQVVAISEMGT
jgi:hypothetical protein